MMEKQEEIQPISHFKPNFHQNKGQQYTAIHLPSSTVVNIHILTHFTHSWIYRWRFQRHHPIIRIFRIELNINNANKSSHSYKLYVEKCKYLVNSLSNVELPYIIYIFKSILSACIGLQSNFGFFKLTGAMVGINSKGQCKIWINEDFTQNICQNPCQNQSQMLESIINVLKPLSVDDNVLTQQFWHQICKKYDKILSTEKLITKFCFLHKILVPPLFRQEQQILQTISKHLRIGSEFNESSEYLQSCSLSKNFQKKMIIPKHHHTFSNLSQHIGKKAKKGVYQQNKIRTEGFEGQQIQEEDSLWYSENADFIVEKQYKNRMWNQDLFLNQDKSGTQFSSGNLSPCQTKSSSRNVSQTISDSSNFASQMGNSVNSPSNFKKNKVKGRLSDKENWKWNIGNSGRMGILKKTHDVKGQVDKQQIVGQFLGRKLQNLPHMITDSIIESPSNGQK